MKCKNCKGPIPKGEETYMNAKVLCRYCFNKAKNFKAYSEIKMIQELRKREEANISSWER